MAKKAAAKMGEGTRVRVKPGATAPEMPDVAIEGWTGTVTELTGPKASPRYIIEWDEATLVRIPDAYRRACEDQGLLYSMACLEGDVLEAV